MSGCRGEIESDDAVPRLFVWCLEAEIPETVEYIEHGIEEEAVSWAVDGGHDGDAIAVAHEAATNSALNIGVSVTADARVVVHHAQLSADEPVFDSAEVTAQTARKLGANSARLAKGTPLKPIG
ncbi:glycerol dehydratase reactivase beta/small subunit family protein [Natronorubrum aibiense]|uniref:Glycerol dehydratase reactivation factor n=1 Tax=Natronorubrum aibiense TaxID=348826 RepID=A0A5P9P8X3_9EURY|nr:glycerol dehydratase reactivase beta/small subunit family protein [Natronorubrum aibiense]QFU84585.1 glycerol dehydratase reactivation factor [Natronorubrum aibiense]